MEGHDYSLVVEMLKDVLGRYRRHTESRGQIAFDCPVCSYDIKGLDHGDHKGNFEVNYTKNAFKCWACSEEGTHGNLFTLFKRWGNKTQLDQLGLVLPSEFLPQKKEYQQVKLPDEFIQFTTAGAGLRCTHFYKQAYNYVKGRGINDELLERYKIGFCYEGKYAYRIIIPSFDKEGKLNYFTSRTYIDAKPKYDNPEAQKETIIFNENLLDFSKDLYIVEGPFDALFVPNPVCLLGKVLFDDLWLKIYNDAQADIYILLDGDAFRDAERLYHKLNGGRLYGRIKLIVLPDEKDIAELQGKYDPEWILELNHE